MIAKIQGCGFDGLRLRKSEMNGAVSIHAAQDDGAGDTEVRECEGFVEGAWDDLLGWDERTGGGLRCRNVC